MKKHDLLKNGNNIIRVLEIQPDKILIIDCIKKTMPVWVESSILDSCSDCTDEVLMRLQILQSQPLMLWILTRKKVCITAIP